MSAVLILDSLADSVGQSPGLLEELEGNVDLSIDEMVTAFALLELGALTEYESPAVDLVDSDGFDEECPCWVILVGFAFAVALAYAAYCTARGGHPNISFGWRGFSVSCR